MNKVVARLKDGTVVKGSTGDFVPTKETFHVLPAGSDRTTKPTPVATRDLKALFFVKDFAGRPEYTPKNEEDTPASAAGRRIKVVFADGEVLVGTTQTYQAGRPGFFMVPADQEANIERCYVVAASTSSVTLL